MQPLIVCRQQWRVARKAYLKSKKALTRMRDLVAAERRRPRALAACGHGGRAGVLGLG